MVDDEHTANSTDSDPEPIRAKAYVGQILGERYRVLSPLGAGGMGMVLLARHTILKKLVAIKVLDSTQLSGADAASRLFREAQAAAAIGHPNIIDVVDVGVSALGDPYLVMEYLDGEDLSSIIAREGPLDSATACAVLEPVLRGLSAAHELGIVHRDVKPQNIFVARKSGGGVQVKLIDFGVAKVTAPGLSPLTRSGQVLGTPSFMSPEQAKGADVDARSDIYSVGVILHHLLTGKTPYGESNYHALLHRIATGEPTLATEELEPYICSVIVHCMQKDPAARPQSAQDLLKALSRVGEWERRGFALKALGRQLIALSAVSSLDPFGAEEDLPSHSQSLPIAARDLRRSFAPAETRHEPQTGLEATMATPGASAAPAPLPAPAPRGPFWTLLIVALLAVTGGALLAIYSLFRGADSRVLVAAPGSEELPFPTGGSNAAGVVPKAASPTAAVMADERAYLQPTSVAAEAPDTVQVQVEELPKDATVTFGGRIMTGSAFRTPYATGPVVLKVEKVGYEPMITAVIPDRDRVIHARLTQRTMTHRVQPSPALSSAGVPTETTPTMGRSGRDSHYSEQFE